MKASKIELNREKRIKIEFPYNQEIAFLIKQIPDAKWNQNLKAWHIPYGKKEFGQLKKLFPEIEYPIQDEIEKKEIENQLKCKVQNAKCKMLSANYKQ